MNGTSLVKQLAGAQPGLNFVWTLVIGFFVILMQAGFALRMVNVGGSELGLRGLRGILGPELFTPAVAVLFLVQRAFADTASAVAASAGREPWRIRFARALRLLPIDEHLSDPYQRVAGRALAGFDFPPKWAGQIRSDMIIETFIPSSDSNASDGFGQRARDART
jgi:hypothetical protein